jgi:predicted site-specific integrase-resolvase
MYTLQNAARVLGVSPRTVRRWMAEDNIEITMLETDRKRIYLAYTDVLALANKHRPLKAQGPDQEQSSPDLTGLYSITDASDLLGVKYEAARRWISASNIERKTVMTNKRRVYISYTDLIALSEKYNRSIAYDKVAKDCDDNTQEETSSQDDRLYSISDAALFLGVAESTVRQWLSQYNIERQRRENDGRHVYISHSDLSMLASKQKHATIHATNITTNIREIKYRLDQIEAGIQRLEQYIKRSIYMGK